MKEFMEEIGGGHHHRDDDIVVILVANDKRLISHAQKVARFSQTFIPFAPMP